MLNLNYYYRLVCEVSYVTPGGDPLSFRKFFKFQVLKPLDVKTKFYNAEVSEKFCFKAWIYLYKMFHY